jgi:hypothetical protein
VKVLPRNREGHTRTLYFSEESFREVVHSGLG